MPSHAKNFIGPPGPMPVAPRAERAALAEPDYLVRFNPQEMNRETDVHFLRWRFRDRDGRAHGRASARRMGSFQTDRATKGRVSSGGLRSERRILELRQDTRLEEGNSRRFHNRKQFR